MFDYFPEDHSRKPLISIQKDVAQRAYIHDDFNDIKLIAGIDQAFTGKIIFSGIIVLDYYSHEIVEREFSIGEVNFPYIPTLLGFREGPSMISAYEKLKNHPDVLIKASSAAPPGLHCVYARAPRVHTRG